MKNFEHNWTGYKNIFTSRRPATQHNFEEPNSILRNESAHGISSVIEASFNRENSCVPPFGAEKFVNSHCRRPDVLQQPLFEEQGRVCERMSCEKPN